MKHTTKKIERAYGSADEIFYSIDYSKVSKELIDLDKQLDKLAKDRLQHKERISVE